MRISSNTMFAAGSARISDMQSALQKTQQQLSTQRRMLTPADDPVAAAQALEVTQAKSVNLQYGVNRQSARSTLNQVETALTGTVSLLQDVRTHAVNAGNAGTLTDNDRATLAMQVEDRLDELISLANSSDGKGSYLFAGYQSSTQPFSKTLTGAQYSGDQGLRYLQVGAARQVPVTESGNAVFEKIKTVVTAPTAIPANGGSGVISTAMVTNVAALTGHSYQLNFSVIAGATTYNVVDTTSSATLSTGNAYIAGQAISFNGLQFDVSGAPVNGDSFTVTPGVDQSIFKTLTDFITTLKTAGTTGLNASVKTTLGNIDQAFDTILTARSAVGSHLAEIESLDSVGADRNLQYSDSLAELQDLDYAQAISEFTQQKTTLEAAMKSFQLISDLSLFKLL